jgi:hypothetical protein
VPPSSAQCCPWPCVARTREWLIHRFFSFKGFLGVYMKPRPWHCCPAGHQS